MSNVIALSNDYRYHRDNVTKVRAAVDFSDQRHIKKTLKLHVEKNRYANNARNFRRTELNRENDHLIKRIQNANSTLKKMIHPASPSPELTLSHQSSNKSISSSISDKTCRSNFRRRTIRMKEIELENRKIAQRIMHPKMSRDVNFSSFVKFYEREQSYSRVRGKFSDRSQTIIQSLALGGLKLDKKNVQFLPQLAYKPF
jgi:hypothetical protein